MLFPLHKHDRSASDSRSQRADASAYALLEEARLRCERLSDQTRQDTECASLKLVHRHLGMAGYLASSRIAHDQRGELLAIAHKHARQPVQDAIRALAKTALSAERAVERALADPLASEDMQVTQTHLTHAMDLLKRHATAGPTPSGQPDPRRPQRSPNSHPPKQNTGR